MDTTADTNNNDTHSELEAWRQVHAHLSKAILVATEAVAVAKAQRRFWCEEIHANLTLEGKLVNTSSWKKSTRKPGTKRKAAGSSAEKATAKRPKKIKLKMPAEADDDAPTNIAQLFEASGVEQGGGYAGDPTGMNPMQMSGAISSFAPVVCRFE